MKRRAKKVGTKTSKPYGKSKKTITKRATRKAASKKRGGGGSGGGRPPRRP